MDEAVGSIGEAVGRAVGSMGEADGRAVGSIGEADGSIDGSPLGCSVGRLLGSKDALGPEVFVGNVVGDFVGFSVGTSKPLHLRPQPDEASKEKPHSRIPAPWAITTSDVAEPKITGRISHETSMVHSDIPDVFAE